MSGAAGLCINCGRCCDGSLYSRAKTSPDEAARVRTYGLIVDTDEKPFGLPCHLLDGATCTIYPDRFRICRTFRCNLVRTVDDGRVNRARADAVIAEAKRLRAAAVRMNDTVGRIAARQTLINQSRDWPGTDDLAERPKKATLHLALVALERCFNGNFRLAPKTPLAQAAGSGAADAKGDA